jgi:hypothetical protein
MPYTPVRRDRTRALSLLRLWAVTAVDAGARRGRLVVARFVAGHSFREVGVLQGGRRPFFMPAWVDASEGSR